MRKHALYASAVVASEEFLSMDTASQALYFQLLCEAETDGELVNVNRIVRATGLGQEALAGLFERDYLIEVGGHIYVRHNWQNNKLNAKVWKSMDSCEPYLSGQLEFEGIEGKTPYRISHTEVSPDRKQGDTQVTPSSETGNNMDTCNSTCTDTNTCNDTGTSTMYGEGDSQGGVPIVLSRV